VAAIVRAADAQERALALSMLERSRQPQWSDAEFEARAAAIGVVFDGMVMRAVNDPTLDRQALAQVIRLVMRALMT
jgi:hypothetical protein